MTDEFRYLEDSFNSLQEIATAKHLKCDPTLFVEIQNYLLHRRVRRLSEEQKSIVAYRMGEKAISISVELDEENIVGGGAMREVVRRLCPYQWKDCSQAALTILEEQDSGGDISSLMDLDEGS